MTPILKIKKEIKVIKIFFWHQISKNDVRVEIKLQVYTSLGFCKFNIFPDKA